ncbi:aquaporin-11-like [Stegodyphus dumicola]|uniref:aquaporin-11-like n=1 Tax=Stegodyphus dumicola TaxID=202533 RepID=UPI0015B1BD8F|nr:aquaporin-11-like [Stegodyphus dumicola]XP_035209555.1 aquaporin-11-like [Stegodyphus dumicola]
MLESIPQPWVPYLVLLLNTLVFHLMRRIFLMFCPVPMRIVIAEIIATLELCTGCAELGVVYEIHGYLGLGLALLAVCFWWCSVWGDAEACPCGPFEECLFGSGFNAEVMKKVLGQAIGGAITSLWLNYIWSFHMIPEHEALHTAAECQAGLQVHMAYGALIEGLITLISRVVALESAFWTAELMISSNAIVTTILVLAATSTTGGFFNPVLATALTLGCKGNTLMEHIVVYWIGSLVGGFIGRYLFEIRFSSRKIKEL